MVRLGLPRPTVNINTKVARLLEVAAGTYACRLSTAAIPNEVVACTATKASQRLRHGTWYEAT